MFTFIPCFTSFLTCWGPRGALLSQTDWVSLKNMSRFFLFYKIINQFCIFFEQIYTPSNCHDLLATPCRHKSALFIPKIVKLLLLLLLSFLIFFFKNPFKIRFFLFPGKLRALQIVIYIIKFFAYIYVSDG